MEVNNITMWPLLKYFRGPEVGCLFLLSCGCLLTLDGHGAEAKRCSSAVLRVAKKTCSIELVPQSD